MKFSVFQERHWPVWRTKLSVQPSQHRPGLMEQGQWCTGWGGAQVWRCPKRQNTAVNLLTISALPQYFSCPVFREPLGAHTLEDELPPKPVNLFLALGNSYGVLSSQGYGKG
jgi:hypothetical protein